MSRRRILPAVCAVVLAATVSTGAAANPADAPGPGMVQRHLLDAIDRAAEPRRSSRSAVSWRRAAVGLAVIPAVHAAAVYPGLFATTRLEDVPRSWSSYVEEGPLAPRPLPLASLVHGVLEDYDLPDLVEVVRPTAD